MHADDIAGVGRLDLGAITRHEGDRIRYLDTFGLSHVMHFHAVGVSARADPQKRDAIPMPGIHVGLDLKNKTRKFAVVRLNDAF